MTASLTKQIPVIGFAAYSGTGKTTLLKQLVAHFQSQGYRVAVLKHAHHAFDTDIPGKDSYELRHAGAAQMVIASNKRIASVEELRTAPSFAECLAKINTDNTDFIFVEGFKNEALKKIELYREAIYQRTRYQLRPLFIADENVLAIAHIKNEPIHVDVPQHITRLDLDKPEEIAGFILQHREKFLLQ